MGKLAVYKLMYLISIIVTLLIVAVTIVAAFGTKINPNENAWMAILGLGLPALLIVNLILFLYWLLRRRLWLWFPLVAILANIGYLTSVIQFSSKGDANGKTLKVATFNIHNFNNEITGFTAKEIARFMEKEQVDIICFQELTPNMDFNLDSIRAVYKNYPFEYIPTQNDQYRISIFSKYPIVQSKFIPFPRSSNAGMWADINVNGKTIRVFNVHMQTTSLNQARAMLAKQQLRGDSETEKEALDDMTESLENNFKMRATQAAEIRAMIDTTRVPVIVCGDFNDTPASYTYRKLKGDLKDGFRTNGNGYGYTYRGLYGLFRIDYILYSPQLSGVDYYSIDIDWSDHNPVIMELAI